MQTTNDNDIDLAVAGMSCGHCVAAVKRALDAVPGIAAARVELGSASLRLEPSADADVVRAAAIRAIEDAGYQSRPGTASAPPATGATLHGLRRA